MQAVALPVPMVGQRKMPAAYDLPGKYLSFEEKPFTDRLQALEESRLAALHYSTGLSATQGILLDDEEHQSILLHDEDVLAPRQRKFRLGRRGNVKTAPPPPTADAQSKPGWPRKLSLRRRKEAPQQPGVDSATPVERTAPDLAPASPASPASLPLAYWPFPVPHRDCRWIPRAHGRRSEDTSRHSATGPTPPKP
jgi:hypothetical protein